MGDAESFRDTFQTSLVWVESLEPDPYQVLLFLGSILEAAHSIHT